MHYANYCTTNCRVCHHIPTHTALQSIQDHRPEGFTLEMLDQELECMALVRALPQEYNAFVSSLLLLDSLDLTKLRSAFQSEELQCSARNSNTTPLMALQAGLARCYYESLRLCKKDSFIHPGSAKKFSTCNAKD